MTDDVPTSDGTRHTEEAVNIPQVTDPRTSSLEDIAQVLSAKTPDIADDPHPEKADSNGAGPAEGSAAEASSADADTDDADTETDTESDAESDAGDGPEPSAEEKAESEAESDQDDAPVEEAEAEAPQEGDAVVRSGDSKDELSEGESVTDEDAQPEADGAESDSDTDPESEAAEGASESVDDAGESESAAESEESSSADEAEVVEEAAEPETEVAESDEDEEDGASAEDSEVTESDVEAGETEEAESVEAEADESQVGEGESAAESEESSSADEAEVVEEAAEPETEAAEPDEAEEHDSESVDDAGEGEPTEPDAPKSSEKESEASEEEPQAGQAAADGTPQDGSAVEAEEAEAEEAGAESKDAVAAPVGEALAAMSAPTPAEAPQPDETSGPVDDQPGAATDEAEADEADESEADEADAAGAASGDDAAQSEPANGEDSPEGAAEGEPAVDEDENAQSEPEPADGESTDSEPEDETDETAEESASVDEEASQDGSAVEAEEAEAEEAGAESKDAVAAPVGEALAAMSAPTPAEALQPDEIPAPAGDEPAADEAARTAGAFDSSGSSDGAAPEAAADSTSARAKAAFAKAKAALTELLHGRGPGRGMMACIIGLGLLVLIWGGAAVATTQHIFAGSTVSGVDVGDMSPAEARQAVDDQVGAALTYPVILTVNDSTDTLVPADSGVAVDADASVDRLVGPTLNPVTLIKRLSGSDVDAVTTVDTEALTAALNERLDTLATGTADAVVTLDGTTPVVTPGATGTGLDVDASVKSLSADWPLGQEAIALASGTAKPAITDEDAQTFVDSVLTPLLADDLTITAVGTSAEKNATGKQLVLSPEQIASLTTISTADGELSAVLDSQRLHDDLIAAMGPIETQAVNAGWTIDGSATGAAGAKPQYVAPSSGEGIDMAALTQQLIDTGTTKSASADRTVAIPMTTTEPDTTTPEADWGITEVTGEFATPFNSEPGRDQNLIRGAEQMNGQVVMSGQTFSVEEALGPVDYEHGFTDAGVISNGQHVDALGGGLSQIGTTMFNVGFEAGMDDVEHHPHSYYFDRYPAGREATLWTGQKDVKFTNSTPYAALIQAWVADGQVHTRIWSTHYYDVSITSSERYNYRPVQTLTRPAGSGCQSYYGGNPGFDITVTRTRTASDKTVPDDVLTTTYDADNNIECTGSAKPSQSLQPGSSTTDQGRSSWEAAPQPIGEADTPAAGGVAAQPQPAQPQDATGAEENLPRAPEGSSDGGSPAGTP
ncbi:VanW family protein [Actinomyces massiliensis]|uniref:VanW family protein n=1 Tax=Actinomyces massiliensis TaxID=461393 RepID=UPI0028E34BEA|nr:VanW family protein [Actinomyces massiliensis]